MERMQLISTPPFVKLCGLVETNQLFSLSVTFISSAFPQTLFDSPYLAFSLQGPLSSQQESLYHPPSMISESITHHPKPGECSHIPFTPQSSGIEIAIGFTWNPVREQRSYALHHCTQSLAQFLTQANFSNIQ